MLDKILTTKDKTRCHKNNLHLLSTVALHTFWLLDGSMLTKRFRSMHKTIIIWIDTLGSWE
ncbi:hypothetical protein BpHYR1_037760 [Brachionus plicatilis]|uniref:Uncharacterized protein n=1 Tax=Brachionus plicatilis TaxID=10195 RepID=A0A3M7RAX2_BRAPC|nr:hypothetical protein BpHYR1_037760 [Brachionus plicatilis]